MAKLASIVARLQIETSRYVKNMQDGRKATKGFSAGLASSLKEVSVIPNPDGLKELDRKLASLEKAAQAKVLRRAANRAIRPALAKARENIPIGVDEHRTYKGRLVAPGFAQRNIKVEVSVSRDKTAAAARLGVAPEAYYAVRFVEQGTAKQEAQPWLVPAFEDTAEQQLAIVAAELKQGIERA